MKTISTHQVLPIQCSDAPALPCIGRPRPVSIILHTTINIEWCFVINIHMIKLCNRNSFWKIPGLTMIVGNAQASISTNNKMLCIIGINPHGVEVGMNSFCFICRYHRCWVKLHTTIITNRQRLIYIV